MIQNPQESNSLFATITTTVDGSEAPVLNISTSLNSNLTGFTINAVILNQDICKNKAADIQDQLNSYISTTIKSKMLSMGYPIVLT